MNEGIAENSEVAGASAEGGDAKASLLEALAIAAEAWEPARVVADRPVAANTKTARLGVMRAIESRNLAVVENALGNGLDPNFFIERQGALTTPLRFCLFNDWSEGALAFIQGGASESAAIAAVEQANPELAKSSNVRNNIPSATESRVLEALFASEADPLIRRQFAMGAQRNQDLARWLVKNGEHGVLTASDWRGSEQQAMIAMQGAAPGVQKEIGAHLARLWRAVPALLKQRVDDRWLESVRANHPPLLAALARSGSAAPRGWRLPVPAGVFLGLSRGFAPSAVCEPVTGWSGRTHRENYSGEITAPIWVVAALIGATKSMAALGGAQELREQALADAQTMALLAQGARAPELREAARQGVNLELCVDAKGHTPLHIACARKDTSKTAILELAKAFPDWIDAKNAQGQTPAQMLKANDARYGISEDEVIAQMEKLAVSRVVKDVKKERAQKERETGRKPSAKAAPKPAARRL